MQDLLKLRESFTRDGILISFNGCFTHSIIEEIGNAIKRHLETQEIESGTITDVFAVYVEQTQNVRNYLKRSGLENSAYGISTLVIISAEGNYTVCSGNTIRKADVADLEERFNTIKSLDRGGLRTLYKQQLRSARKDDSVGAGVGLIDIARRASEQVQYRFDSLDDAHDFFSLFVTVKGI